MFIGNEKEMKDMQNGICQTITKPFKNIFKSLCSMTVKTIDQVMFIETKHYRVASLLEIKYLFLGMVQYDDLTQLAVADLPGLIRGSSENKGLGYAFLQHVQRCRKRKYTENMPQT